MKSRTFTLAILLTTLLFSCSKKHVLEDESTSSLNASDGIITGWEGGYAWHRSDSAGYFVFMHQEVMPELTPSILEKGAVLVALKNVPYKEDSLQTIPKLAPFSVIPYYGHDQAGKPNCDQHWYIIPGVANISVKYRTNRHLFSEMPVLAPDARVEVRYFILPELELKRLGHTQESISLLTYQDLVKLLGTNG